MVTRDKDYAQLIRAGDVYWDYSDNARYRYDEIEARFGVQPERFADLRRMGDSVDNIKGVPGVGTKTAAALMKEFVSLEELYDNLDRVAEIPVRGTGNSPRSSANIVKPRFWRGDSPKSPATCPSRLRVQTSHVALRTSSALTAFFSIATTSGRCCAGRPRDSRSCRSRPDYSTLSRLLFGTVTRPPIDSCPWFRCCLRSP